MCVNTTAVIAAEVEFSLERSVVHQRTSHIIQQQKELRISPVPKQSRAEKNLKDNVLETSVASDFEQEPIKSRSCFVIGNSQYFLLSFICRGPTQSIMIKKSMEFIISIFTQFVTMEKETQVIIQ
ncbi:hypothetical protein AMECASPLE_038867 [Ameca splendens]|uniref:Uncharacterized protein n=1 Tax=Ameca splendens TaxID=208324 RepID=A0ABV0ZHD7_9TELE